MAYTSLLYMKMWLTSYTPDHSHSTVTAQAHVHLRMHSHGVCLFVCLKFYFTSQTKRALNDAQYRDALMAIMVIHDMYTSCNLYTQESH